MPEFGRVGGVILHLQTFSGDQLRFTKRDFIELDMQHSQECKNAFCVKKW